MQLARAIDQLIHQLLQVRVSAPGQQQLCVPLSPDTDALNWLDAQTCWPQFYWQDRSGEALMAACGALEEFDSTLSATRRLASLPAGWRLPGANRFDGSSFFFLPALLWQQDATGQRLMLNLVSDGSLQQEARRDRKSVV